MTRELIIEDHGHPYYIWVDYKEIKDLSDDYVELILESSPDRYYEEQKNRAKNTNLGMFTNMQDLIDFCVSSDKISPRYKKKFLEHLTTLM
jgi:hypothetical protein